GLQPDQSLQSPGRAEQHRQPDLRRVREQHSTADSRQVRRPVLSEADMLKHLLRTACAAGIVVTMWSAAAIAAGDGGSPREGSLPIVSEHRYRMLARVRPLLFWISKDDVGGAKVSWRANGPGEFGLELLIGSDPLKAPRSVNKWGYIAEEVRGTDARVIGVMKQSNEQSIDDAEKQLGAEGRGGFTYRAIQGTSTAIEARAGVTSVNVTRDLTYRDI